MTGRAAVLQATGGNQVEAARRLGRSDKNRAAVAQGRWWPAVLIRIRLSDHAANFLGFAQLECTVVLLRRS